MESTELTERIKSVVGSALGELPQVVTDRINGLEQDLQILHPLYEADGRNEGVPVVDFSGNFGGLTTLEKLEGLERGGYLNIRKVNVNGNKVAFMTEAGTKYMKECISCKEMLQRLDRELRPYVR